MKIIVRPRRAGKTYEIIKESAEHNYYIICPNKTQVKDLVVTSRELGLIIPTPITWQEFLQQKYYGRNINGFLIDNLDMCIQSSTPVEIKTVSLNGAAE